MDTEAIMHPRRLLRVMTSIAGIVVFIESIDLLSHVTPASFAGLGVLSIDTASSILLQIATLSLMISVLSLLGFMNNIDLVWRCQRWTTWASLLVGSVLCIEGLATISLRNSIAFGATAAMMTVIGLQMHALGVMAVTTYAWDRWNLSLARAIPSIGVLLFFILLLPSSLLVR